MNLRRAAIMAAAALALGAFVSGTFEAPATASAHPLGNFTVNRYARVELGATGVSVRYVIDMAEIPAFQEKREVDANGDGAVDRAESDAYLSKRTPALLRGLDLRVGGRSVALEPASRALSFPVGQGGLDTLRLVLDLRGMLPEGWQTGTEASFEDTNYADRIGWKQVVVRAAAGVALTQSSAPVEDETAELTSYPPEALKSPADVRSARFRFEAGGPSAPPAPLAVETGSGVSKPGRVGDAFARLVSRERLTPAFIAASLLVAMAWGAAHALGPGHGKTLVAAYLVGSRGTARQALVLGLTVTATHTSTVVLLGLATLYASRFVSTEDLYLWLSVASGLVVVAMGAVLFVSRLRSLRRRRWLVQGPSTLRSGSGQALGRGSGRTAEGWSPRHEHAHDADLTHDHDGSHGHDHEHAHHDNGDGHGHSHLPPRPGLRGLIMLGVSGGLLPCPTALVVMLGAIALDRVVYGLALVAAFSFGLAGVLTGLGLLIVYAGRLAGGSGRLGRIAGAGLTRRWLRAAPLLSSVAIFAVGLVLTGRAVAGL